MPPIRRQRAGSQRRKATANYGNEPSIQQLRQQCLDKGLPDHGRRNLLIARLQQHATITNNVLRPAESHDNSDNVQPSEVRESRNEIQQGTQNQSETPLFNSAQLVQIRSIITQTVQESVNEIATTAARAVVQAMPNTSVSTASRDEARQNQDQLHVADATSSILHNNDIATRQQPMPTQTNTNCLPYGHSFHDVPASYIKQIQTGEFFELSKLLPKNLFATTNEQPVSLTLENSTLKVKTSTQSVTNITDIKQWTTAFTTYMSVFTHEFPNRSQEFLQYMSIILHAAQCHKGMGCCIYDIKLRRKAALNHALDWAKIDQQLWLMIFTVPSRF